MIFISDGIFCKVKELDQVSGSLSFVVVVCLERETCYYYGASSLLSLFFTTGIKYQDLLANLNVRKYDLNEELFNTCVVPNCVVSRNTLAKWRMVAMERFGFPRQLSVSLHLCPDEERDKWMAEIDLDPNFKVCYYISNVDFRLKFGLVINLRLEISVISEFNVPNLIVIFITENI